MAQNNILSQIDKLENILNEMDAFLEGTEQSTEVKAETNTAKYSIDMMRLSRFSEIVNNSKY